MVYFPMLCHVYLCVEFLHNEQSFAKCVQATGKNCNIITLLFLGFFIVAVLPVLTTMTRYNWNVTCGEEMGCSPLVRRSVWFMFMSFINAVMIYFYITALANETDSVGWGCLIGFLRLLWTVVNFTYSFNDWDFPRLVPVYLFGSVGVVLISAVSLMTELILKTVNGERAVGDLRIVVFSCESFLIFFLLILLVFKPWIKTCQQSCQNAARARSHRTQDARSNQNENQSSQETKSYEFETE
ncbi:uncharacterized protein LOC127647785 isoform X2 [Xyrauchen texanus]|uniref:uncharacterized protein LOC127647785 isoform X2 n=1 Tax=Xyrauchen texanus TaxID=154827 RepID=UPI002242B087|nr:uncharacterized protein LOC127647785 isoform X2 [Xyrauchen texanus]